MEIAVVTGLPAKRDMKIDTCHSDNLICSEINYNFPTS